MWKTIYKVQHPLMIKTLSKVGVERPYFNMVKAIHEKPTANFILNRQKLKTFPIKIRNKTSVSTFPTSIQNSIGSPRHSDQPRERNQRHPNRKGRSNTVIVCR